MHTIAAFYKELLGFEHYYSLIAGNAQQHPEEFIASKRFLQGIERDTRDHSDAGIKTVAGDSRIDVPVWFGNRNKCAIRIVVFGLEPRDTDAAFNVEKLGNKVYGAPFGVDRWNHRSSVKRKPQNKYYRVFEELIEREDVFVLFSDVVKYYRIIHAENAKGSNDKHARDNFFTYAMAEKMGLLQELALIDPTHIIALGGDAFDGIKMILPNKKNLHGLRHPAQGGEKKANEQLRQLLLKS